MQAVKTIGLDIAKSIFQVHGVDADGQVVIRRKLKRRYVLAFFQKLPIGTLDVIDHCFDVAQCKIGARDRLIFAGWFVHRRFARRTTVVSIIAHVDDVAALHEPVRPGIVLVLKVKVAGRWAGCAMEKEDYVVTGKPSVALCHFFANENLNSRIRSVDLHIIFDNSRLLGRDGSAADKYSQQRDDRFFQIVPPRVLH